VKLKTINALFAKYKDPAAGGATVLVAQNGEVFIDHAFGIGPQARYMPRTTLPQFPIGDIATTFTEFCAQLPPPPARGNPGRDSTVADTTAAGRGRGRGGGPPPTPLQACVSRVSGPIGAHQTAATADGQINSSVDELYRFSHGLEATPIARDVDFAKGWTSDTYKGETRLAAYATADGKRAAFVRVPSRHITIVILTNDATADARGMADKILDELLSATRQ
jgi:hypothetical protein